MSITSGPGDRVGSEEEIERQRREERERGSEFFCDVKDKLEAHSVAARDALREWTKQVLFEEKSIPELQDGLRDILAPFPDISNKFSSFLEADTATVEACAVAKDHLCQMCGFVTMKAPPGTRQKMDQGVSAAVQFMKLLEQRAQQENKSQLIDEVSHQMLQGVRDQDESARQQRRVQIEGILSSEPELLAKFRAIYEHVGSSEF